MGLILIICTIGVGLQVRRLLATELAPAHSGTVAGTDPPSTMVTGLRHGSGTGPAVAARSLAFRALNGSLTDREDLLGVSGIGLSRDHEYVLYIPITREPWETRVDLVEDAVPRLSRWLTDERYPASFLTITRSQKLETEALGQMPPGGLETIETVLLRSPDFAVWYSNEDVTIFVAAGREIGR
jgi:hypothetical protein